MATEKEKALELTISQIEKRFGKGSLMKLGESAAMSLVEAIPSGSLALDLEEIVQRLGKPFCYDEPTPEGIKKKCKTPLFLDRDSEHHVRSAFRWIKRILSPKRDGDEPLPGGG